VAVCAATSDLWEIAVSIEHGPSDDWTSDPRLSGQFVQLFAQVRDGLFAYIFSLLPHWSDAEDVFQQTSLVLWRKFGDFQPGSSFLAWACRVAFFEVRNFRRTAGRDRLRFGDALLGQLAAERDVSREITNRKRELLIDCIAKLSEDQRRLLDRAYEQNDMTIQQLAEELHRAPQTIYNRLNLIRRTLFECLQAAMQRQKARQ
jgi:RNA polymerase sigma-70 factor, ECF subfamily